MNSVKMSGRQISFSFTVKKETLLTPNPAGAEYLIMSKDGSACQGQFKFDGKVDPPAAEQSASSAFVKSEPGLEQNEVSGAQVTPTVKDEPMDFGNATPAVNDSGYFEGEPDINNNF